MYFVSTLLSCTFRGKNINAYKKRNTPNDKTNTNVNIMNLHLSYGDVGKLDKYLQHLKPTSLRVILGVSQQLLSSQSLSLPILHPHVVFLCHPMLSSVLLTVFAKKYSHINHFAGLGGIRRALSDSQHFPNSLYFCLTFFYAYGSLQN